MAPAFLIGSPASAQNEEIGELRSIYFQQVEQVSTPVVKKYGQALVELKKELIAENKLEEALVIKKEIERLKAKLEGAPAPLRSAAPVETKPAKGEEVAGDQTVDGDENCLRQGYGSQEGKGGFSQERIWEVLEAGGRLPVAAALRCRVRYFTDGAVLGGQRFVDEFFERKKDQFGIRRKDGGRRMRGAQWGGLRVLRDLRENVVG